MVIRQALTDAGYTLVEPGAQVSCDVVVDHISRNATELRAVVSALGASVGQYLLISSHRVYSTSAHLRPWREDQADVSMDLSLAMPGASCAARATERELRLLARKRFAFTILRPSLLEADSASEFEPSGW